MRSLVRRKKYFTEELRAIEAYKNKDYKTAGQIFEFLLTKKITYKTVFQNALGAYLADEDDEGILRIYRKFSHNFRLTEEDYIYTGAIKAGKKLYAEAKSDFDKAFAINPKHLTALCNLGYYHIIIDYFNKALAYFDDALAINPVFAHVFSNRGLAKIKLGKITEGLKDIYDAIELDSQNPYSYRSLGIYCQDIGNYPEALYNFKRAFEIDAKTHLIVELIRETEITLIKQTADTEPNHSF